MKKSRTEGKRILYLRLTEDMVLLLADKAMVK
jgi:hypothetical protein